MHFVLIGPATFRQRFSKSFAAATVTDLLATALPFDAALIGTLLGRPFSPKTTLSKHKLY